MSLATSAYKGARDFYPADKRIQNYIFDVWRKTVEQFGYEEYDASVIEPIELYLAKTSEEIVSEQTYVFEDRGGRKVTLRPEMTPSVSRMVAGKRQELSYPLRWYSIPNVWRYERPQRGRLREHWQLNVDLFGEPGLPGDHELIMVADSIMQRFGATRDMYTILVNSRKLVNIILHEVLGLDADTGVQVIRLVDRIKKMPAADFMAALTQLTGDKATYIDQIFRSESFVALPEQLRTHEAAQPVMQVIDLLNATGVSNVRFDVSLMRGFDYYTDIVFEMIDTNPENNRSMFGGGRYDGLVGLFGVEPVPTVGFGMGDVTIRDFLETHHLLPELTTGVQATVILIGDVYQSAQPLLAQLREAGLAVAVDAANRKVDKKIKNAAKSGIQHVLFVGEEELAKDEFALKDLTTGQEQHLSLSNIITTLKTR